MGEQVTGIVLAGGRSSRMGRDKALVAIAGVPLLRRTVEIAGACAAQVYVVTPWPERYGEILPPNCGVIREMGRVEAGESQGPLVAFAQGLAQVATAWVLLLACDLPQLTAADLEEWLLLLPHLQEIAYLPRSPQGWEPLCGFYRRSCLRSLEEFIKAGGRSFQTWLGTQSVREMRLKNPDCLFNCNTPADLAKIYDKEAFL
ncbi:MAG: molybdenum cofactor guanylyltransferase [Chloroflexaceae bacterium]|nr:molybdenum cofactor guanylyltransferase [Chloroflexaceae bacterium]